MIYNRIFYSFLLITLVSYGQSSNFQFDHLTVESGLSSNTILCTYQDSRGFLWIGTYHGLNRYDGNEFKVYKNVEGDETSLSDNKIRAICEDNNGNLWIGTWEGGLDRFDRDREKFKRYTHNPDDSTSISNDNVFSVCCDKMGNVWAGTAGGGLNLFDIKNEKFTCYTNNPRDSTTLSDDIIYSLLVDETGTLWIGTQNGGLNKFDNNSKKFYHYKHNPHDQKSIGSNWVTSICEDHLGYLWLTTVRGGLNKFDRKSKEFIHYTHEAGNPASISSDNLWTVLEDSKYKLWIGTTDKGLYLFDRNKNEFIHIKKSYENEKGLNDDGIFSILEDRSGIIWFGTWNGGLNKYDKAKDNFRTYFHNPYDKNSLSDNDVQAIYEDNFKELWVGTATHGLDRFSKDRTKVVHYTFNPDNPKSISSNNINSICEDKDGYIWIGTDGGGLNKYDRKTDKFIHFRHDPGNSGSIGSDKISSMLCDSHGDLWIGVANKLDRLIINENKFIHYGNNPVDSTNLNFSLIYSIYEDNFNNIWIGTWEGLFKYDRKIDRFTHYIHDPQNLNTSLSSNVVSVIMQDKEGNYWIGTDGGGINRFEPGKKEFKHYIEKDGLANDVVHGILEDNNGFLWISTEDGISKFNQVNGTFLNYDAEDGFQGNVFNQWAYYKDSEGMMYFGGSNGLTEFNPDKVKNNLHKPEIVITDINLFHKTVSIGYDSLLGRTILEKSIIETKQIVLNHDDNIISFEISALDFKNPGKNKYAYFMEGFDKEWTYKDAAQRFITYTNLSPGKYTLKVRGSNSDGIWNNTGTSLIIIIKHPWWATWWAYSLYAIIFLFIFTGTTRFYLNRQRLKNQLELEYEHSKKLAEVDQIKSNFFTNISHEFRTPLTLILGPSNNILKKSVDENAKRDAEKIKRNAGRLLGLINQLLDLSRLDERKLKLKAYEANIVSFTRGVAMSFEAFAESKDLSLKIKSSKNYIPLYFDSDKMEKVLINLFSNAVKFTPRGGEIRVSIEEINNESVEIKIIDTGIGIPEKEIPKLFDRFYQVDGSQTREYEGSGLGLSLTKEFIELHHGTINVKSKVANALAGKPGWTEFTVKLPLGRKHLKEEEVLEKEVLSEAPAYVVLDEESLYRKNVNGVKDSECTESDQTIILVVEDNKDMREYIRDFLVDEYIIEEAINGEQGVRKAEKIIPDLIVSDVMMPKMDGNQLTRILKNDEKTSHIPIILLTAKSDKESKVEGLETGADDYLIKPFDTEELQIRIRNLIDTRRKLQEKFSKVESALHRTDKHLNNLDKNFIDKINNVIQNHLAEEGFSIEEMGKEVNMSRSQLHRKLTALTGKSPSIYMRSLRLARAKEMIGENIGNISEIAYSVGFSSPAYFTRCFKEEFGIPPSEFGNHAHNQ